MTVKIHSNAIRKSPQISQNLRPRLVALKRAKDKRKRSFRSRLKVQQKVAKGGTRSNYDLPIQGTQLEPFNLFSHWLTIFRTYLFSFSKSSEQLLHTS